LVSERNNKPETDLMEPNRNELQVGIAELERGLADEKAVHEETKRQLRVVNSLYQKQQQRITELEQAAKHFYDFATKYRSFGLWNSEEARALAKALAFN